MTNGAPTIRPRTSDVKTILARMGQTEFVQEAVAGWQRLHADDEAIANLGIMQKILWAGRLLDDVLETVAQHSGFGQRGDYEVAALLKRHQPQPLTPADVAQRLLTSRSGITGRLDRLETNGLLQRQPHPTDRRLVNLVLTPQGEEAVTDTLSLGLTVYRNALADLDPDQRTELDQLLDTVLNRLDQLHTRRQPWT